VRSRRRIRHPGSTTNKWGCRPRWCGPSCGAAASRFTTAGPAAAGVGPHAARRQSRRYASSTSNPSGAPKTWPPSWIPRSMWCCEPDMPMECRSGNAAAAAPPSPGSRAHRQPLRRRADQRGAGWAHRPAAARWRRHCGAVPRTGTADCVAARRAVPRRRLLQQPDRVTHRTTQVVVRRGRVPRLRFNRRGGQTA